MCRKNTACSARTLKALADQVHDIANIGAAIASGSFRCSGMVVAPCSMRTLAAIAHGLSDNLITRAADVLLKERRRLVLMVRESPLHLVHLRNMVSVTEIGAIVCPPMPAFYLRPQTVDDIVDFSVARALDLLDVPHTLAAAGGLERPPKRYERHELPRPARLHGPTGKRRASCAASPSRCRRIWK